MAEVIEKWADGMALKVCSDSTFYFFCRDGYWKKCNMVKVGRPEEGRRKYLSVVWMKNGEERRGYAHRLLAEAFIPNPGNKRIVSFRDGNSLNISLDNLFWADASDLKRQKKVFQCTECGKKIVYSQKEKVQLCRTCMQRQYSRRRSEKTSQKKEQKLEEFKDLLLRANISLDTRYVRMHLAGYSVTEIAKCYGCSKQCVSAFLIHLRKKAEKLDQLRPLPGTATEEEQPDIREDDITITRIKDLGLAIRKKRQERGLTQARICKQLGISAEDYRNLETHPERYPDRSKVWDVLQILNVNLFVNGRYFGQEWFPEYSR
ncbi:MAG: HNH endonuclease [Lachnospiraceae bacterium]|nr:HNH endonuclease [Lachnospiraceae bacterium]MBR3736611.1 HNH endonuclease [Lachnospiraceae bacterium]